MIDIAFLVWDCRVLLSIAVFLVCCYLSVHIVTHNHVQNIEKGVAKCVLRPYKYAESIQSSPFGKRGLQWNA